MIARWIKFAALSCCILVLTCPIPTTGLAAESDPVLATVNGLPIRLSYVYQHIESLPIGDQIDVREQMDRFTESVVQEEVLFQYALHHFIDDEPLIREKIKTTLLGHLIESQVDSRIDVLDSDIQTYYEEHRSELRGEHWRVYQIPLRSVAQCERLVSSARNLESFTALARQHGVDKILAERDGDMGYVMLYHNVLGLGDRLLQLSLNQTHQINTEDGCHLIWISEHVKPPLPTLNTLKERIRQMLVRKNKVSLLEALLDKAAKDVRVVRRLSTPDSTLSIQ